MNAKSKLILCVAMAAITMLPLDLLARGGGGGSRGGGSMRSAPSVSRPSASRPSPSRPSPSAPSASRPSTSHSYSGSAARPSSMNRTSVDRTSVDRTAMPVSIPAGSTRVNDARTGARPASQVQSPVTIPPTRTSRSDRPGAQPGIGDARPASGGITTIPSSRPATTSAARRNVPLSVDRPDNYGSISRTAAVAGITAAGVGLAANSTRSGAGNVNRGTGPRGGDYASVEGPRGELGVIRGPGGGEAVVGQRPGGEVGAAVRGPRGNTAVGTLPVNADRIYWGGHDYYCHGYYWYSPFWYHDNWYYEYRYPPVNYWYETLPASNETVVIEGETYYYSDAVYYQAGTQDGEEGYIVVPPPATNSTGEALMVLLRMCDFLGAVTSLTADVAVTMDRYLETGDKVPVTGQSQIRIRQPDRMAIDATSDSLNQRIVYDGKMVTMVDRLTNRTIGIGAPPRLEDLLPELSQRYGKPMPFGDLLQRDAFDKLSLDLVDAAYVGVREVGGEACHHVAFMRDDIDWELWAKTGDEPFPLKITITYKHAPGSPRYTWECHQWEINLPLPDEAFAEDAPAEKPAAPAG